MLVFASMRSAALVLALVLAAAGPAFAEPKVVFLGDSLTEGFEVAPEKAFPALVGERLRARGWPALEVINAGVSGSTSASAVSRMQWQLKAKPDVVVLALGANDGLRGIDPATMQTNLAEAIDVARSANAVVLLAGMKLPPNYGADYTERFEKVFGDLAKEKGVPLLPFLLDGVATHPELNLGDGIHPNADGYSIIADTVITHLVPVLEALRKGEGS